MPALRFIFQYGDLIKIRSSKLAQGRIELAAKSGDLGLIPIPSRDLISSLVENLSQKVVL